MFSIGEMRSRGGMGLKDLAVESPECESWLVTFVAWQEDPTEPMSCGGCGQSIQPEVHL